jgi:uncharacterized protein YyaL (SSP411 family)
MKKKYWIGALLIIFLTTGCSVEIETSSSKSEEFASTADELSSTFVDVKDKMEPLVDKKELTSEDQKLIIQEVNNLKQEIKNFKEEEAPFLAKKIKQMALKELNKKEEILVDVKEKAENEMATVEDVEKIIKTISDDFEINLFK